MLGLSSKLSKPIENAKVVRNGLKLWHKYRDDATDSSQEANHGTAFTGRALEFDGVADHLTGLPSPTSEMTISLWVYPLSSAAGGLITWDESGGNHDYDFVLYRSGGKIVAKWDTDTLETTVTGNYSLLENTWYRVTVTQSSDTFKIYINGQLDISSSITAHLSGSRVGAVGRMYANTYNSENFFSGIMSDVQVWDTAWTQDDVTFDFNNPDKLPIDICNNSATLEIDDCVKHLQINEGNGTSLYDGMGGDSGVITGCEWATGQDVCDQTGFKSYNIEEIGGLDILLTDAGGGVDARGNALQNINDGHLTLHGDGFVDCGVISDFDYAIGEDFSIEVWIYYTGDFNNEYGIMGTGGTGGYNRGWELYVDNSNNRIILEIDGDNDAHNRYFAYHTFIPNQWQMITSVCKWDGDELNIERFVGLDSQGITNCADPGNINHSKDFKIGRASGFCLLDAPKIYNKALTQAERTRNYRAGQPTHRND
jgi:hypothetical protein